MQCNTTFFLALLTVFFYLFADFVDFSVLLAYMFGAPFEAMVETDRTEAGKPRQRRRRVYQTVQAYKTKFDDRMTKETVPKQPAISTASAAATATAPNEHENDALLERES